ncbi:Hypothetical predicted protein [Cloeon dipterum]|uniref:Uncharacterized protein n=1 Tax=Cloeon dipterum TaxID=197152 RepID=A0A8S1CB10_9INSE|nr:Hypothetical predicted protein [Cloeon dipterum]
MTLPRYFQLELGPKCITEFSLVGRLAQVDEINVTCSELRNEDQLRGFPHFPQVKLARFCCNQYSARALWHFLKTNGNTLNKLVVWNLESKEQISFGNIFCCCPNLKTLILEHSHLCGNDAPAVGIQQLRHFTWHFTPSDSDLIAFSSILWAPQLEELEIHGAKFDFSDNSTIIPLIVNRDILRKLKKFSMLKPREDYLESDDDSGDENYEELKTRTSEFTRRRLNSSRNNSPAYKRHCILPL